MRSAGGEHYPQNFVIQINNEKCIGCQKCVSVCARGVFKLQMLDGKRKAYVAKPEKCLGEGHCRYNCPTDAIIAEGETKAAL